MVNCVVIKIYGLHKILKLKRTQFVSVFLLHKFGYSGIIGVFTDEPG